jgi:hypothetical protein
VKPLVLADILPLPAFAAARPTLERAVIRAKEARRIAVGPNLTLLFENRVTLRWQVHEMCRVEQIDKPEAIAHELDTYNGLLPGRDELSATLLVEYDEPVERARMLAALRGLERHFWLDVDGARVLASFDDEQFNDARISSVQFLRFRLSAAEADVLCDLRRPAAFVVDHPAYTARAPLTGAARGALVEDLLETRA